MLRSVCYFMLCQYSRKIAINCCELSTASEQHRISAEENPGKHSQIDQLCCVFFFFYNSALRKLPQLMIYLHSALQKLLTRRTDS